LQAAWKWRPARVHVLRFSGFAEGLAALRHDAPGTFPVTARFACGTRPDGRRDCKGEPMNGLIYLVGLIVVIMAILSLFGLR
jgi:hypothetical protein